MEPTTVTVLRWRPDVDLATRLRLVRRDYGRRVGHRVSMAEMASLLGESEGTYKSWEAGGRPADPVAVAKRLYELTGADPAWLLDVADDAPNTPEGLDISPTGWNGGTLIAFRARRTTPRPLAA